MPVTRDDVLSALGNMPIASEELLRAFFDRRHPDIVVRAYAWANLASNNFADVYGADQFLFVQLSDAGEALSTALSNLAAARNAGVTNLDALAKWYGLERLPDEADDRLRVRLVERVAAGLNPPEPVSASENQE
jgi:hypothetical protein